MIPPGPAEHEQRRPSLFQHETTLHHYLRFIKVNIAAAYPSTGARFTANPAQRICQRRSGPGYVERFQYNSNRPSSTSSAVSAVAERHIQQSIQSAMDSAAMTPSCTNLTVVPGAVRPLPRPLQAPGQ